MPVTAAELRQARKEVEEYNKRPIKKVMEAIGRRKRRLSKRLEAVKPKAEAIANSTEMSEGLKIKQM